MVSGGWQDKARARRRKQRESIPREWLLEHVPQDLNVLDIPEKSGLLTPQELEITNTGVDIDLLLAKLASGEWSSVEVTTAYYKRAIIAHQLTNCLTEIFVDRALERAKEVDDYLSRTGKVIGPLHGLPISLKDQIRLKGLETIMGYVSYIDDYAEYDAVVTELLYEAGAVPFVRTNVPQTLMWGETHNNVFGRTFNPLNRSLTPGGSSGGEAALIAMKGSPIGIGTDIGGSVRIPTAFTGLYALRPSTHRLPYSGLKNSSQGQESIHSVIGPMAPSLSALRVFTKAIIDEKPWKKDPACVRLGWSSDLANLSEHGGKNAPLCFAVMWDSGIVRPTPPVRRALEITVKALREAGHAVIDWENYKHDEIHINTHAIYFADGDEDASRACDQSGEPLLAPSDLVPSSEEHLAFEYLSGPIPPPDDALSSATQLAVPMERYVLAQHLGVSSTLLPNTASAPPSNVKKESNAGDEKLQFDDPSGYEPNSTGASDRFNGLSAWKLWNLHAERRKLQKGYLDHWERTIEKTGTGRPVDAIISPAAAYAAPPHGYNSDAFYTALWNGLDYTACVLPVTVVDEKIDVKEERHVFHNHEDEHVYRWYDPQIFKDAPVGLQVVGRTHEEEAVLSMAEIVEAALKKAQ